MATDETEGFTDDGLRGGTIAYRQPLRGHRVGLEAPLLAAFALCPGRRPPRAVIDLGAGPGAVGLCLARSLPDAQLTLFEADPLAARFARGNAERNGWSGRIRVVEGDVAGADARLGRGGFDLVVSNPPWFSRSQGPPAEGASREAARGLPAAGLAAFLGAARQLLGPRGRVVLSFPSPSMAALFAALARLGLSPKRLRLLHPRAGDDAQVLFVEALAGRPGGLVIEPPWFVRGPGEEYTPEVRGLLWG